MAMGASSVVEGAPRERLPHGLFSVISLRPEGDGRWQNDVSWESLTCGPVSGVGNPDCTPGDSVATGLPKNLVGDVPIGEASRFSVYGTFKCSPVGRALEASQDLARQHLIAREEARVELAFWTGDLDNTPNLQDSATDIAGAAHDPVRAIGELESYLGSNYGSLGVIHMTLEAALVAYAANALEVRGGQLQTALGTPVVAGAGYPGTSPAGAAPAAGTSWVMASPAVFGYRSDIFYPSNRQGDLLDREVNDLYALAERAYLLGFDDCGVGAVRMNLV